MTKTIKYFKHLFTLVFMFLAVFILASCKPKQDPPKPNPVVPTMEVKLENDNIFLRGKTNLSVVITPAESSQEYKTEVSEQNIISINNGSIEGLSEGTVTITVTSKAYPDLSKKVNVTVMPDLKEEQFVASHIVSGPGENASTSAVIKYNAFNKNTSVEYTLASDTSFSNAKKLSGSCYYFYEKDDDLGIYFSERYIYRTYLDNLTPDTEYIYRINNGDDTYSEIFSFATAKGSGDTTFIYLTDTHYWVKADGTSHGSEISEKTIKAIAEKHPEATFVLDSGDTIDTGGDYRIWDVMHEHRESFKTLQYAAVPGNHEYYVNGTGMWDNRFFKSMVPTLLNGPDCKNLGSTYYFIYNDVLFLMVDNVKADCYNDQMAWMEDMLRNANYKYSVVTYHIPTHEDNTDHDDKFNNLFQKYGVDLVLAGHYHTEDFDFVYDNVDIGSGDAGVTFFRGASSGMKGDSPVGYAITISEEGHISIKTYNTAGALLKTFEYDTIKYKPATPSDVNVELVENLEEGYANINWGSGAYGKYSKIVVTESLRGAFTQEVLILSKGYTGIKVPLDRSGYDSVFKIEMTKLDGSVETVTKEVKTNTGSLSVSPSTNSASLSIGKSTDFIFDILMDHYDVYLNGSKIGSISYQDTVYILSNLSKNTSYTVELRAIDYDGQVAYVLKQEFKTNK